MENIAFRASKYQVALRRASVSLPLDLVLELLGLLEQLRSAGTVRQSVSGEYSILDFIANVVSKKSPREVWKRLQEENPNTVTFCDSVKLPRKDGKKANIESPVTSEFGILLIAYILPGDFGDRLRKASANLLITTIGAYKESLNALLSQPIDTNPAFPYSSTQLQEWVSYCNLSYLREVIRTDYQLGTDYIEIEKELYTNSDTAQMVLNFARPKNGVTIPDELKACPFPWDKLQAHKERKINRRRSCSKSKSQVSPGQLSFL